MRKKFEAGYKARIALEAVKGDKTLGQLSSEYGVHGNLVSRWKKELLKGAIEIFRKGNGKQGNEQGETTAELYKSIGELKVENDWLKKKLQLLD